MPWRRRLERESQVTSERYRAYPHLLIQEATNLSRQVDNLLAYARITDVTETYAFEPMAAAELVDEAVKGFQPRLGENGVRVDVDLPEDLPFVRADQRAMVLALKNLIDNGLRHARDGEHGHLRIAVRRVGPSALIEVQDNGCGISAKKLAALRESIASRAFAPADGGGLGAGDRQQGGRGPRRHLDGRQHVGDGNSLRHRTAGLLTTMAHRILVVEDDPTLRLVLRDNLQSEGYEVDVAADGASALRRARTTIPDLIVLDLTLPDHDGFELLPILRVAGSGADYRADRAYSAERETERTDARRG